MLADQAGWQIGVLPALAEQLHRETANCQRHRLSDPRRQAIQNALIEMTCEVQYMEAPPSPTE